MESSLFLKGLIIGVSIAAPVGPIGVLCIQRTLTGGLIHGWFSGLGAATADAVYGLIAAFGLTFVSNLLVEYNIWFRLVGGIFLCFLGIKSFLSKPSYQMVSKDNSSRWGLYGSTFFLTLANPMTILSFAAIFAGLGMTGTAAAGYALAGLMVAGVFSGSILWWLFLSGTTSILRGKLDREKVAWVNRFAGLIVFSFGLLALLSVFR